MDLDWTRWLDETPDWLPPLERKWFRARNQGSALAALVHGCLAITFALFGVWPIVVVEIAVTPIFLGLIALQWAGWTRAVSIIAHVEANVHVLALAMIMGPVSGFSLYFFTLSILPLLMFPPRDRGLQALFTAMPAVCWIAAEIFQISPPMWAQVSPEAMVFLHILNVWGAFGTLVASALAFSMGSEALDRELESQRARNWDLLVHVMPERIAVRLRDTPGVIADRHTEVTVMFADLAGFTELSARLEPEQLVGLLDEVFTAFDRLAERHHVEKIKTIGDAYMAAAGVPGSSHDHADAIARLAVDMLATIEEVRVRTGHDLQLRVGMHTGPVMAGVIGGQGFRYDLWGDTVNTASRMEALGQPGRVQVTEATASLLRERWPLHERGEIEVKGKGRMSTCWLEAPPTREVISG